MQTFLPYPDFQQSVACLDQKRLGKQRVEAHQILSVLDCKQKCITRKPDGRKIGWLNHPAVLMWVGYEMALQMYANACVKEWINQGHNNNYLFFPVLEAPMPPWFGDPTFHASHRSNLLRKNLKHYSQFGWSEPDDLPYVWPKP